MAGLLRCFACVAALFYGTAASAGLLFDTGPGAYTSSGIIVAGGDYGQQTLAANFQLSGLTTIDSVQGWINPMLDGELTASVFSNSGIAPDARLFSASFVLVAANGSPQWIGPTGLNWNLASGDYWVVFEGLPGQTGLASMPDGVAYPMSSYASLSVPGTAWDVYGNQSAAWGVQIAGVSSVPESPVTALMGFGLVVVALSAHRFRLSHRS